MAEQTASGYIQHHLQNLTFGHLPNGEWGFAHTAAEAKEMGFWAFHVDTLGWSVALGLIFVLIFRMAAKKATSGQPGALPQRGHRATGVDHFRLGLPDERGRPGTGGLDSTAGDDDLG
jgi:hypothetical protein